MICFLMYDAPLGEGWGGGEISVFIHEDGKDGKALK